MDKLSIVILIVIVIMVEVLRLQVHHIHPLQGEDAHGVAEQVLSHLKVLVVICLHGWHIQTEKEINVHIATDIILINIHDVHHVMCPDNALRHRDGSPRLAFSHIVEILTVDACT
jgi:hypothetical protein